MKKVCLFLLLFCFCTINVEALKLVNEEVDIYALAPKYKDKVTIPDKYKKSYKIEVEGASGTPTYSTNYTNYIEISKDGVVTPKLITWYCKGNVCSTSMSDYTSSYQTYNFKDDITINVRVDGESLVQKINLKSYATQYSRDLMDDYLKENIKEGMTEYEKAKVIAKLVASYSYSTNSSSYSSFFLNGGGDCIASSSVIVYMTNKIGIKSHIRYAVYDAGAGNNHHNVAAVLDGELYIIEAGYVGSAPRFYDIIPTDNGLSYYYSKGFYQYDGYDEILNIPVLKNTDNTLKDITIDELILYIGKHDNTKLHTINVPSNVVTIKGGAFSGLDTLKNINIDTSNKKYVSIDNVVYTKDQKTLVTYPAGKDDLTYNIINGTEKIDSFAFAYAKKLKHIVIPATVTNIGYRSFMYTSLIDVDIPSSVAEIGDGAFYGSSKLASIYINNKDTKIGVDAIPSNTVIMGYKGSTAEEYANKHGNKFVEINNNYKKISIEMISGIIDEMEYDGTNKLDILIKDGDYILKEGTDYTLEYSNNTKVGTATLVINGIGNYRGYYNISYKINPKKITYKIKSSTIEYGEKLNITTNVNDSNLKIYYGRLDIPNVLYSSIPYTNVGSYKMLLRITCPNYETINETIDLKIIGVDISNFNLSSIINSYEYTGKEITNYVNVFNSKKGHYLVNSEDYIVTYNNNINVGTAGMIITGIGNYRGSITKEFKITPKGIYKTKISGIIDKNFNGENITQNVKITDGDIVLEENKDYKISYSKNNKVGIANVIITGMGNYTGTIEKPFKINGKLISNLKIDNIVNKTYTGKSITQNVKITDNDKILVINKDYKLNYKNNKNIGTATITITGIGDYTGSISKTFKIVVGKVDNVAISSQSKDSISIKWNKPSGSISGYEVYYSTKKDSGYKKISTTSKTSYKKTKLSSNKIYYFKVRTYKNINKKKYYGSYSPVLAATTATSTPSVKLSGSKNSVTISWGKVSGATSYDVYQSIDNKTFIKLTNTTNNSYVSTNLNSATTYYYKVRAIKTYNNLNIKSSYSKITSTTTKPDQVVTNGFSSTSSSISIKWNKVVRASGYDIYQSTDNKKFTKIARVSKGTTTSYKKTKLSSNKVYYYKVRAYKVVSKKYYYGSYSDVIATTTATKTPSIKVSSGNKTATISWSKVSGATSYDVYQGIDNKTFTKLTNTTSTSYVAENLNSATTYYYKVRAVKTYNDLNIKSSYSKLVSGTTKPDIPVVKLAPTKNSIKINWNKVSRVNGYEIYQSTDNKKYTKVATITKGSTTSYNKTKLKSNKTYFYKVRAYKTISGKKYYGSWSTIKNIKVK